MPSADKPNDEDVFTKSSSTILGLIFSAVNGPVTWFREKIVLPNRQENYYYHERIKRVPTIDQCLVQDAVCIHEAEVQYQRDKMVDKNILDILMKRRGYCLADNPYDPEDCKEVIEAFERNRTNFVIKYGELGLRSSAYNCLMKQKNRMAFERRYGPVGSGRNKKQDVEN